LEPRFEIVLASASPRRRRLLEEAGLRFRIEPAGVDESLPAAVDPEHAARSLAERKARAVGEAYRATPVLAIGSDTIVAVPVATPGAAPRILGKPEDPAEARAMLASLSGTTHAVWTGVCVYDAARDRAEVDAECTRVTMRALAAGEIDAYVASGEWRDKAGGYAIQESADAFVTALEGGGFDNVVGLPVARTMALLARAGYRVDAVRGGP